jgi:hypothetical protein
MTDVIKMDLQVKTFHHPGGARNIKYIYPWVYTPFKGI